MSKGLEDKCDWCGHARIEHFQNEVWGAEDWFFIDEECLIDGCHCKYFKEPKGEVVGK